MNDAIADMRTLVDEVYRVESRRVFATLIRLLGDFDLAEEALHDAFTAAVEQWSREGVPANPRAWLVSTGRFKAIDNIRRRARFDAALGTIAERARRPRRTSSSEVDEEGIEDDRLRLIFTCCHPALAPEARMALTLREVCGLTTEEIASAFLTTPRTLAQRIVRAKSQDPGRQHPIPGAGAGRAAGAAGDGPPRHLPRLQRGLLRLVRRHAHPGRSLRRGDPPRPPAGRAAARAGGDRPARPDAAARVPPRGPHLARRRSGPARGSGPLALEPGADRARARRSSSARSASGQFGPYTIQAAISAVHARRRPPPRPTGRRSSRLYDTLLADRSRRRWSSSTARSPWPCAMARPAGWP